MIKIFATKETAALFANEKGRRLPPEILQVARRKLAQLHRVSSIEELQDGEVTAFFRNAQSRQF
ncbi:MAG: hypothetical protein IT528_10225 [Nitrosomonas sp.]|jgi:proteic killer suppression protein|nr:hypothetical protein [Nitrosomonas sp.]